MNKVDVKLEVRESNLRDEIDAWKDASGLRVSGGHDSATPKMLKQHIANLNRNIETLNKSSAIGIQKRDRLSVLIQGMECKNKGLDWFFFGKLFDNCGHCDVCVVKAASQKG